MKNKNTGTSMCGSIEYTHIGSKKKFLNKIENIKKENAKVCLNCKSNIDGYCRKHNGWCGKVNYICNGYDMSYADKLQENRRNKELRNKEKYTKKNKAKKKKVNKNKKKKS